MRTDAQILADRELNDTTMDREREISPQNFNIFLLLEVLLDIRKHQSDIFDKQGDILNKLNDILIELQSA